MIDLRLDDLQHLDHGQRVHAHRHVLAVIFEHAERQHDRPVLARSPCGSGAAASFRSACGLLHVGVAGAHRWRRFRRASLRSAATIASNSRNIAPSKIDPIGRTELAAADWSLAMVCAGSTSTKSARRGSGPSGCEVSTITCAPALRATRTSALTVARSPGPELAKNRSPASERRHVHFAEGVRVQPAMIEPHRQRADHKPLAPAAVEPHAPHARNQAAGLVQPGLIDLRQRSAEFTQRLREEIVHVRLLRRFDRARPSGPWSDRRLRADADVRRAYMSSVARSPARSRPATGFQRAMSPGCTSPTASAARKASP